MSKIKSAAAFVDATLKLTSAQSAMAKAAIAGDGAGVDAAIGQLEAAVNAFREARKTIETKQT